MASTSQIIDWVKQDAPGWNRTGVHGILPILNEAHNILAQNETEQMVAYDASTGRFPLLTTTAGTYQYDMPSDIWRVNEVLVEASSYNEYDLNYSLNVISGTNSKKFYQRKWYRGKEYIRITGIKTIDARRGQNCKVIFDFDPGTGSLFYYRGYLKPTQITSERIELIIPEKFHLSHVVPAVIKLIEGFQNHTWDKSLAFIEEKYKRDIINEMNKGEQGEDGFIERREI